MALSDTQIEVLKRLSEAGLDSKQIKDLDRSVNKSGFASGGKGGPEITKVKKAVPKDDLTGYGEKNFLLPQALWKQHQNKERPKSRRPAAIKAVQQEAIKRRLAKSGGKVSPRQAHINKLQGK
jgi:hypothetical protein